MLDVSHIPSQNQQTFTFYSTGNWQTWSKPRNAKMIEIFCLGGGGSGGHPLISSSSGTGGGGGGSGGIVRGIIPAFLLPDIIYIFVGKGGIGPKTASTSGSAGGISYVGLQPSILEKTLICKSSTTSAGGGNSTGPAGLGATISIVALSAFGNLGMFTSVAGVIGGTGISTTGAGGSSQIALGSNIITGGAGGGGKGSGIEYVGIDITPASVILTSRVSGGQTIGANGESGYGRLQPFCGTGGAGGAAILIGVGGAGGDGWYGCGGGGSGSGSIVSKAGNGGDGLVIITVIT